MPKAPTLTEKQMKFAELLIFGNPKDGTPMSASEAAFKAGYRTRPRQSASELQNRKIYPLVVKYRDELKEEVMQKYGINYQRHLEDLGKLRDKSSKLQQMSAAINAEKTRGQVGGLNIERKLIEIRDVLGRSVNVTSNKILLYIYENGTVERKFIFD